MSSFHDKSDERRRGHSGRQSQPNHSSDSGRYEHPYPSPKGFDGFHRNPSSYVPLMGHHHFPGQYPARTTQQLQTVVTNSFSEERDDTVGRAGSSTSHRYGPSMAQGHDHFIPHMASGTEDRYPSDSRPRYAQEERQVAARSVYPAHHEMAGDVNKPPPLKIPPSPMKGSPHGTFRSPSLSRHSDSLKRSFWHHSRPEDSAGQGTHPAFLPPKRPKNSYPQKSQITITARTDRGDGSVFRSQSWGPADGRDAMHPQVRQSSSFPAQSGWSSPRTPSQAFYPSIEVSKEYPHQQPNLSSSAQTPACSTVHGYQPWHPPPYGQHWENSHMGSPREATRASWNSPTNASMQHYHENSMMGIDSREERDVDMHRQVAYEKRQEPFPSDFRGACAGSMEVENSKDAVTPLSTHKQTGSKIMFGRVSEQPFKHDTSRINGTLQLLGQPEDRISLSETLCLVRENIEVFTATQADVDAPAPGRKHTVVVGQVGLRCIYCRHTTNYSDRVKRAVCYPSSIQRIYRTVIDMKLDHFQHCPFVPHALKDRLNQLKSINSRSTGTTMQYFVRSAKKMGMLDGPSGVRMSLTATEGPITESPSKKTTDPAVSSPSTSLSMISPESPRQENNTEVREPMSVDSEEGSRVSGDESREPSGSDLSVGASSHEQQHEADLCEFTGKVVLALPEDATALSPLRCFLRENVCAFSATEEDIAVRTPTTFSVKLGQVGIGCIHCHSLPAKERSNRAVCFPFSISRIYQSVADIQRFHLSECKLVPPEVREKFDFLQSKSSKGSKGLATRQYWVSSAKKIGLVDTSQGIRFGRDPSVPSAPAVSLDILAQVASNVTTVNRNLVVPEDKASIAEFLYVVMEQLQPCRFTEADRNKRRLKDVGCIGVECKHCAGQVESRKFFWSSVNAVESNFVSVHTHMMECKMVPEALKLRLAELKKLRKEQTARLKIGSQKAFFSRVWKRLHGEEAKPPVASARPSAAVQNDAETAIVSV